MSISRIKVECSNTACSLHDSGDFIHCELVRDHKEDRDIKILFVGEGPGRDEASSGRPFVGKTGTLLRKVIGHAKPEGMNVAYSNAVRCMPTEGDKIRAPFDDEISHCRPFLLRDIERIDPDVIVALGNSAIKALLQIPEPKIGKLHGQHQEVEIAGRKRVVYMTWHPSYISRNLSQIPMFLDEVKVACKMATGWRPNPEWGKVGKSTLLKTVKEVEEYITFLRRGLTKKHGVGLDVESLNLYKRHGNKLGMIQFASDIREAFCIPLDHPKTPFDAGELEIIKALLWKLFMNKVSFGYWVPHNGGFEQNLIGEHILRRNGKMNWTFKNVPMVDSMSGEYLLNENKTLNGAEKAYRLKLIARERLGFIHYDEGTLALRSTGSLFDLPLECPVEPGEDGWFSNLTDYGGMDAYVPLRLLESQREEARDQRYSVKWEALQRHLFSRNTRLLSVMERNGFWANLAHLNKLRDPDDSPIVSRILEINQEVRSIESAQVTNKAMAKSTSGGHEPLFRPAGEETPWVLDLAKDVHIREWLAGTLALEAPKKTDKGLASVGKEFFLEHKGIPESDLCQEHRQLSKLDNSYLKPLVEWIDPSFGHRDSIDGRIRADFHFNSTVTGRGTCTNPNMHQQPSPSNEAKAAIKSIFQAEQPGVQKTMRLDLRKGKPKRAYAPVAPTNCLVQLDFKTSEVRWWAIMSGCPDLARAFNNGKSLWDEYRANPSPELLLKAEIEGDLHRQTASIMYGMDIADVEKKERTDSKSIVFGWMFGRGDEAIAAFIKKTVEVTKKLVAQFGDKFPLGRDYLHGLPDVAREHWYTESPIGRRRRFPGFMVEQDDRRSMSKDERRLTGGLKRQAMNSGIQGQSSDAAFIGAGIFLDYIEDHGLGDWKIQNVVHDSCVFQVPITDLAKALAVAERCFTVETMEFITEIWGLKFNCPIEVDFEIGLKWGHLTKWDYTEPSLDTIVESFAAAA